MCRKVVYLVLGLFVLCGLSQALVLSIQPPIADTYLDKDEKNINHGEDEVLILDKPAAKQKNVLVWFDISAIPTGKRIIQGNLSLYLFNGTGDAFYAEAHEITRSWIENGATWNTYDGVNAWDDPGGDYNETALSTILVNNTEGWYTWDITPALKNWYYGYTDNYGIIIVASAPTGVTEHPKIFYSREWSNTTQRAKLEFTYEEPWETNLSIWDDTDTTEKEIDENIYFYANYTNSSNGVSLNSNGICRIWFEDTDTWVDMRYNSTTLLYEYNRTFSEAGMYSWKVNCSKPEYQIQEANDTVSVLAPQYLPIYLYIDGQDDNVTKDWEDTNTTINVSSFPEGVYVQLYINGTMVINQTTPYTYLQVFDAGYYNITAEYSGEDYIQNSSTLFLTVNKVGVEINLTLNDQTNNLTVYSGTLTKAVANSSYGEVQLYRNGVLVENPDIQVLPVGTYYYNASYPGDINHYPNSTGLWLYVKERPSGGGGGGGISILSILPENVSMNMTNATLNETLPKGLEVSINSHSIKLGPLETAGVIMLGFFILGKILS